MVNIEFTIKYADGTPITDGWISIFSNAIDGKRHPAVRVRDGFAAVPLPDNYYEDVPGVDQLILEVEAEVEYPTGRDPDGNVTTTAKQVYDLYKLVVEDMIHLTVGGMEPELDEMHEEIYEGDTLELTVVARNIPTRISMILRYEGDAAGAVHKIMPGSQTVTIDDVWDTRYADGKQVHTTGLAKDEMEGYTLNIVSPYRVDEIPIDLWGDDKQGTLSLMKYKKTGNVYHYVYRFDVDLKLFDIIPDHGVGDEDDPEFVGPPRPQPDDSDDGDDGNDGDDEESEGEEFPWTGFLLLGGIIGLGIYLLIRQRSE